MQTLPEDTQMKNEFSPESSEPTYLEEPELAPDDAKFTDETPPSNSPVQQAAPSDADLDEVGEDRLTDGRNLVTKVLLDIDAGSANKFSVKAADADIDIQVHSSNRLLVTATTLQGVDLTSFDVAMRRQSLNLSFLPEKRRLRKVLRGNTDKVRLTVHLPARFGVAASSTTGAITAGGFKGTTTVSSISGCVTLNDLAGPVRVETKSGNISGCCGSSSVYLATKSGNIAFDGLTGGAVCHTKTGEAHLTWSDVPDDSKVVIHSGTGPTSLYFPPAAKLNYRFITGANAIMNEFEQCDTSNFRVRMVSRRGNFFLKKITSAS